MEIDQVYDKIRTYIINVLNDINIKVIYADQIESPIPKKPFVTMSIGKLTNVSQPMRYEIDNLGIRRILLNKTFLLTLESYADVTHQSEKILTKIEDYFSTEIAFNHFKGELVYKKTIMGVSALPKAISGINESRSILEVEFNLVKRIDDNVGLIEHIYITDLNNNKEIIINK